ncbi:MAG TPA: pilus assembly protein TadG-related protein [Mycobacteriales bacterium]|nr:pilus assembly protein TadG-related protein [Mycobacteriales bacterium]
MSRFRESDDGSVAVLAAVTIPVVLLCVALATAAIVWSSSEHETQRAADTAAVRAASTAFLGTDFPYQQLPGLTTPLTYPDVEAIAALAHLTPPVDASECGTVGLPRVGVPSIDPNAVVPTLPAPVPSTSPLPTTDPVTAPDTVTLPASCPAVAPFAPEVALTAADESGTAACAAASAAMTDEVAPYANRFHDGTGDPLPTCTDGRIRVKLATGSPLVGFGQTVADAATGQLQTRVVPEYPSVAEALAAFGIRLDTSLPSLICPEISVDVDQPVREPVFDRASVPNGRATARRIVKNAVVVPVYEGDAIVAATDGAVHASAAGGGVDMATTSGTTVTIPPRNLNATLLDGQRELLGLLDEVDAVADAALRAENVTVDHLNGTYSGVSPTLPQPPPAPGTAPLETLRLTKCLRDTLAQIYDPPSGDAPTTDEVLAAAAASGEPVIAVQVGTVRADCTEPGAIRVRRHRVATAPTPTLTDECVRAATTPQYNPLTGLYEVPFFDATPVLVQDVGSKNYEAVPVHASQASGAFRGGLVRDRDHDRYDPDVRQPTPTPICNATLPTGSTACGILSVSPSPLPTATVVVSTPPPVSPTPTPSPLVTVTVPVTLPVATPTPTLTTSPLPTVTVSPICIGLGCPK